MTHARAVARVSHAAARAPWRAGVAVLAALLLAVAPRAGAQRTDETTVHAAYLVNFLRYATWPVDDGRRVFVVAVLGSGDTANAIREVAERAPVIAGRRVEVRHVPVNAVAPERDQAVPALRRRLPGAHLVYVAPSHASWQRGLIEATAGEAMLTVGTGAGFAAAGGMFELFEADERVYFAVNESVLAHAPVRVSARVVQLARPAPASGG